MPLDPRRLGLGHRARRPALTVHVVVGELDGAGRERCRSRRRPRARHRRARPHPAVPRLGPARRVHRRRRPGARQGRAGRRRASGSIVAGAGPFLLPVASSLLRTGAKVVEVLEAGRLARSRAAGWRARGSWPAPPARPPSWPGTSVSWPGTGSRTAPAARSSPRTARHASRRSRWRGSTTAGARSRAPSAASRSTRSASATASPLAWNSRSPPAARLADGFVAVDADQRTSVPGVFAAGEITGIGGSDLARAEGALAGALAAGADPAEPALRTSRRRLVRLRGFAARIEAAHGIRPGWTGWVAEDTVVCRCEEVTAGELRRIAAVTDSHSLRSVKLTTRAGLGICQARICGRTVEALVAERTALSGFDPARSTPVPSPCRSGSANSPPSTPNALSRPERKLHDHPDLGGVVVATALPYREDASAPAGLAVDYDRFAEHCSWLLDNGCRGVGPNGSLGEYSSLTDAERRKVVQVAVETQPGPRHRHRRRARSRLAPGQEVGRTRRRGRCGRRAVPAADDVPVDPRPGGRALRQGGRGRAAGDDLQQPDRHQGRPDPGAGRRDRRRSRTSLRSRSSPATCGARSRSASCATSRSSPAPTTCCSNCWWTVRPAGSPASRTPSPPSRWRSTTWFRPAGSTRRARCTSTWWPLSAGIRAPSSSRRSSSAWTWSAGTAAPAVRRVAHSPLRWSSRCAPTCSARWTISRIGPGRPAGTSSAA